MKRAGLAAVMAALMFAAAPAAVAVEPSTAVTRTSVGGVDVTVPAPTGFCTPTGSLAQIAESITAGDPDSTTFASFVPCSALRSGVPTEFIAITAPRVSLNRTTTRAELDTEFNSFDEQTMTDIVQGAVNEAAADRPSSIDVQMDSTLRIVDRDTNAIYLMATFRASDGGATVTYLLGAAAMVVRGKVVVINWVRFVPNDRPLLLRDLKAAAAGLQRANV